MQTLPIAAPQTVALPRLLEIGGGARHRLNAVRDRLGCRRSAVVTDATVLRLGLAADLLAALGEATVVVIPPGEPTEAGLQEALATLRGIDVDSLVAIGGGSVIDSAKVLSVLVPRPGRVAGLAVPTVTDTPGLTVIAVPTTAGTGSEATRFTIIGDVGPDGSERKLLCPGLAFLPAAALVDYELTLGLPPRASADTGIDALTHALEAYVSRRAGPVSDGFALQALALIAPNLRRVVAAGVNHPARDAVMLGATYAGLAFSNASVALVHGMSRPIGARFHVPHGLSNAMLLPTVTAWSLDAAPTRYAEAARAMGLNGIDDLVPWLQALNDDLDVPTPARFGIAADAWEQAIPTMADQALASGSPANNPRLADAVAIAELYHDVFEN